jgi:hypothetical protein
MVRCARIAYTGESRWHYAEAAGRRDYVPGTAVKPLVASLRRELLLGVADPRLGVFSRYG